MALLQISEPGKSTNPHERRLAVGIDLGTTNSLIATVRSGEAIVLPDEEGRYLLPSVVRFRAEGSPQIGYPALDASINDPMNTIASSVSYKYCISFFSIIAGSTFSPPPQESSTLLPVRKLRTLAFTTIALRAVLFCEMSRTTKISHTTF